MKTHIFYVSRQSYWGVEPEDQNVVEVAQGGTDYANADMLVTSYASEGEGQEYVGQTAAVEAAIKVAKAWKRDQPKLNIKVAVGCTHGMSMPFEGEEDTRNLLESAAKFDESLPHCSQCGEICESEAKDPDEVYCSESCREKAMIEEATFNSMVEIEETMSDYEIDYNDLVGIISVGDHTRKLLSGKPEEERHEWLLRRLLESWSADEVIREIEDSYSED